MSPNDNRKLAERQGRKAKGLRFACAGYDRLVTEKGYFYKEILILGID